jgi:hypothetical protein
MSAISVTSRGVGKYAALLLALLTLAALMVLPGAVPPAQAAGVTVSKQVTRQNINPDGSAGTTETKTVSLTVEQTEDLQPRQRIEVSWTGARPSQGYSPRTPLAEAYSNTEYPVALMQCRGVDAGSRQIDPRSCFTTYQLSRYNEGFATFAAPDEYDSAPWLLDRHATAADRNPNPAEPPGCWDQSAWAAQHYLPFIDAKGKSWPYCVSIDGTVVTPPESGVNTPLPAQDQFAWSDASGAGRTYFEVRTKAENASLGCSDTVACSLVVVPIMGISCDLSATSSTYMRDQCAADGNAPVGPDVQEQYQKDPVVTGAYWWSASNWRNRISVPLEFAPPANICDVLDTRSPVDLYGSELLSEAMLQWSPAFCLDPKRFKLRHQRVGEPRAKRQLESGQAVGALVSRPPGEDPAKPTVYAPTAISGFAIGYVWDKEVDPATNVSPGEVTDLKLTPRLLAKLVTQSYRGDSRGAAHPTVGANPDNLESDPEFRALNPTALSRTGYTGTAALTSISADSDVIAEFTRYIDSDPVARAWLDGTPDQWGTRVNPKFRGIQFPVETLPLLDDWEFPTDYFANCTHEAGLRWLNMIANPMASLAATSIAGLDAQPSGITVCELDQNLQREVWKRTPRQIVGARRTLVLASLADAEKYKLRKAALQSRPGSFVAPDLGTMRTAMRFTALDKKTGTLPLDYALIRSNEAGEFAYPGTMLIYTAAVTEGMKAADAEHVAEFMRFSVNEGQQVGEGNGKLPQGYLPITRESGLGSLIDRTMLLADTVEKQTGEEPPPPDDLGPDDKVPPGSSGPGTGPGLGNNNSSGPGSNLPNGNSNLPVSTPSTAPTSGVNPSASPTATNDDGRKQAEQALTNASTRGERSWLAQWALPLLLLLGLLGGVAAPVVVASARPGHPVRRALAGLWKMQRSLRSRLRRD